MSKRQRIPEGHQRFFFAIDKEDAIRLQIRARFHGLSRLKLFKLLADGYLNQDPDLMKYVHKAIESDEIQSKRARNLTKELYTSGIQESQNLGLSDEDKENIFDILENVSPFAD
jgi:hypothetical protein